MLGQKVEWVVVGHSGGRLQFTSHCAQRRNRKNKLDSKILCCLVFVYLILTYTYLGRENLN